MPVETEERILSFKDKATGYQCRMVRHISMGHWCGYVGIRKPHTLFGKDYNYDEDLISRLDEVHGGITFSGLLDQPEDSSTWYFGFDCAHSGDIVPGGEYGFGGKGGVYRDVSYVKKHIKLLASLLHQSSVTV